jgi:type IV secretion system protein VirD4
MGNVSRWGRLCPPLLACLDELPSTAPLPTLRTRMANERALFGLTNVLVMFGGSKDGAFNQEVSDLVGQVRVTRRTWQTGAMAGRSFSGEDIAILRPEEIRRLKEHQALVLAENGKPIIARLARCIDGKAGRRLLADQRQLRARLAERQLGAPTAADRAAAAPGRGATSRNC